MAISNIPIPASAICRNFTALKSGVRRCNISSKARIVRLNMQLPSRVPKARSGRPIRTAELTPVTSSGTDVMAAKSIRPIHIPPKPVFLAITSPYRASFVPASRMMTRQARNFNQTKVWVNNVLKGYYIRSKLVKNIAGIVGWYGIITITKERCPSGLWCRSRKALVGMPPSPPRYDLLLSCQSEKQLLYLAVLPRATGC